MKTRAKYLLAPAFYIILGLPQQGYPQNWKNLEGVAVTPLGDGDIFDSYIIPIPPKKESTKLCKPRIATQIDCGNGTVSWVKNSYTIKINKNMKPANKYAKFYEGFGQTRLSKKYCFAKELRIKGIRKFIMGDKLHLTYEALVTGGSGGVKPISIEQYCKLAPPE